MNPPLVTVLMPAYNAAMHLHEAINSILVQTYADFELLIIDDCSTDSSLKIIASYADPRIRLISNPVNLKLVKTLNLGIQAAHGKYIARLDADDVAYPTRLAEQVAVLEHDANIGMVASWTEIIDENGVTKGYGNWVFTPEAIFYVLHFRNCLTHSSATFRTDLVRQLGGYRAEAVHTEDMDLWHRISIQKKIIQIPRPLVKWREHAGSITSTDSDTMKKNALLRCQENLLKLTTVCYPAEQVCAFVDSKAASQLPPAARKPFSDNVLTIDTLIRAAAPACYDMKILKQYADIELAAHYFILRHLGTAVDVGRVSSNARLEGFLTYASRYRQIPFVELLITKSHF